MSFWKIVGAVIVASIALPLAVWLVAMVGAGLFTFVGYLIDKAKSKAGLRQEAA